MKLFLRRLCLATALVSAASNAFAQSGIVEISDMQGKVLVNVGNGYTAVPNQSLLNEGDMVMIGDSSSAIVVYLDTNCRVRLPPRTVTTITLPDPCKTAAVVPASGGPSFLASPVTWIALGGLAFAGGVAFLVTNHDNEEGNDTPSSPP